MLQLAGSVRRVCQWLEQPVTFSDWKHTPQLPVTSSALTWHVNTPLKAPRHPPASAHLSLDAHEVHTRLLTYHTIKPLKAVLASRQSYVFGHMPLRSQLSLLLLPLCSSISPPLFSTQSHAYTLSGSISSDWIDGPQALLLTKTLPNMVSYWEIMLSCHSIWDGDPLCQS